MQEGEAKLGTLHSLRSMFRDNNKHIIPCTNTATHRDPPLDR